MSVTVNSTELLLIRELARLSGVSVNPHMREPILLADILRELGGNPTRQDTIPRLWQKILDAKGGSSNPNDTNWVTLYKLCGEVGADRQPSNTRYRLIYNLIQAGGIGPTGPAYDEDIQITYDNLLAAGVSASSLEPADADDAYTELLKYVTRTDILAALDVANLATGSGTSANIIRGWDGSASAADPAAGRATLNGGVTWDSGWLKTDATNGYVSIPHSGTTFTDKCILIFQVRQDASPTSAERLAVFWNGVNEDGVGSDSNIVLYNNGTSGGNVSCFVNGSIEILGPSWASIGEVRTYALLINGTSLKLRYDGTNYTGTRSTAANVGGNSVVFGAGVQSTGAGKLFSPTSFSIAYGASFTTEPTDSQIDAVVAAIEASV